MRKIILWHAFLVATLLFLNSSVVSPILGLRGSQSISSYGMVSHPSMKPIFLVYPSSSTSESVIRNVISATQDLTNYFDVAYLVDLKSWNGNFTKLEEIIAIFTKYDVNVVVMVLFGWKNESAKPQLTSSQIAYLKQKYKNLVGLRIAEYFTAQPENSTMLSYYEAVLQAARENDLWVVHEEEWWTWGRGRGTMNINFTALTPVIQRYNDVMIPTTKMNGASVQYWSWGVNIGYALAFGARWGVDVEAWYWYEVRNRVAGTEMEMPVDVLINSALYALVHNATYLHLEGPPWYFFNVDGTPKDALLKFKKALFRYFDNGAPKACLPRIAILNLPINFKITNVAQTGVEVTTGFGLLPDLFSYFGGRTGDVVARNIQKAFYGFTYDAEGLINTKTLIPVLPWGTPIEILRNFQFVMVQVPLKWWNPTYNFTCVINPQTVYNYLLEASRYVDLFIPQALIFAVNITDYYDSVLGRRIFNMQHLDHSALTGLNPPYKRQALSYSEATVNVTFTHEKYAKSVITESDKTVFLTPASLRQNARVIAVANSTHPFMWHYVNEYGKETYTIYEGLDVVLRHWIRDYIGELLASIASRYIDDLSSFGVILYDREYTSAKYNTPEMAIRDSATYEAHARGNVVLYAPFAFSNGMHYVYLSLITPYALIKNITGFKGFVKNATEPITLVLYDSVKRKLELTVDATYKTISTTDIYWPYDNIPVVSCKGSEEFTWAWNSTTKIVTLVATHSTPIIWMLS